MLQRGSSGGPARLRRWSDELRWWSGEVPSVVDEELLPYLLLFSYSLPFLLEFSLVKNEGSIYRFSGAPLFTRKSRDSPLFPPLFSGEMSGDRLPPRDLVIRGAPIPQHDCEYRPNKEARVDETTSTVTNDFLFLFCKNYHFPNDVKTMVPKRSDRASLPPSGYLTVSETHIRAGLRFPPSTELIEVLQRCGVNLSQFSFRAMSVTVGLIALFRDRGATMTPEHLSRMGRFTKKWGKMKDLSSPLHVREEDIMRILKVPDLDHLLFEVLHMSKYTEEEFLFKVGLSFYAGRSDARMLKPTSRVPEHPAPTSKAAPKRPTRDEDPQFSHLGIEIDDWNSEFVKIKYLQGEFKRKYDQKVKEVKVLEEELSECRTELANIMHYVSLQNWQANRHQIDLEEAQETITRLLKDQKASKEKIASLEEKDKKSHSLIAEKEADLSGTEPSKVIEDFKKSIAFKTIIQDHVQEARDHVYDIEVKGLEQQCTEDGFIRGFFKGVRLMQWKTGVYVEGVTPSQTSDDFPSGSDGDEVDSDLRKVLDLMWMMRL
ncbi:hypothetical protein MA16_Dca017141 [Dendrobium catenatum]|uniref:Uncharacterized protein n=1 Tax=Dendrobium catenatum TaxID=906689 RepID=A0A2I0W2H2_9ASPA|nr:hypothetical protein MA16_Dca017141 [Dendrobium catenatum]